MFLFNGKSKVLYERAEDATQQIFQTLSDSPDAIKSGMLELLQLMPDCKEIEFKSNKKTVCSIQKISVSKFNP